MSVRIKKKNVGRPQGNAVVQAQEQPQTRNRQSHIIHLGKPYIRKMQDGKSRLCAMFSMDGSEKEIYFEVDSKWEKYLVTEVSDPFVLATVELAMRTGQDLQFEQPMSEELYYSLTTYMIPIYARNFHIFREISLIGKTTEEKIESEGMAGTGFSAGVDSFYSVLKNMGNEKCVKHNVTHILLAVNGAAATGVSERLDREWLEASRKKMQPYADELGLELVCVSGNLDLLYVENRCMNGDTVMTASFVYALQKLFGIYYWASAYPAELFQFEDVEHPDGGWHENVSVPYVSTKAIHFYHSGSETNRIGKVAFIADNPVVQKGLTVCGESDAKNCGYCFKCLRTMAELNAIGKLDDFKEAFPVENYKKHYIKMLAREFAVDHPPFTTDIVNAMKKNHKCIPIRSYLLAYLFYRPAEHLRKKFSRKTWARKLYYKLNLDEIYGGRRQSDEERAHKLAGEFK